MRTCQFPFPRKHLHTAALLSSLLWAANASAGTVRVQRVNAAGAVAFGIGAPLLAPDEEATSRNIHRALALARGGQ